MAVGIKDTGFCRRGPRWVVKVGGGFLGKKIVRFSLWGPGPGDFQQGECSVMQVN